MRLNGLTHFFLITVMIGAVFSVGAFATSENSFLKKEAPITYKITPAVSFCKQENLGFQLPTHWEGGSSSWTYFINYDTYKATQYFTLFKRGESLDNWTELFAITASTPPSDSPLAYVESTFRQIQKKLARKAPEAFFNAEYLRKDPLNVVATWSITNVNTPLQNGWTNREEMIFAKKYAHTEQPFFRLAPSYKDSHLFVIRYVSKKPFLQDAEKKKALLAWFDTWFIESEE